MATILKQGKIKVNKAKYTCSRCDTVAEFETYEINLCYDLIRRINGRQRKT